MAGDAAGKLGRMVGLGLWRSLDPLRARPIAASQAPLARWDVSETPVCNLSSSERPNRPQNAV